LPRANELVEQHPVLTMRFKPLTYRANFGIGIFQHPNIGRWPVKDGNGMAPIFHIPVHVRHFRTQQTIRLSPDLMRGAVVDPQSPGPAANIHAQRLPGKGGLKYPLTRITGKKEAVGSLTAYCRQKPQLGHTDILGLIHHGKIKRRVATFGYGQWYASAL